MAAGSLKELITCIGRIPDDLQSWLIGESRGDKRKVQSWAAEKLQQKVHEIRYYDDHWDQSDGCLAHYTSWENAIAIFSEGEPMMRMYNYEVANDPLEGRAQPKEWVEVRRGAEWLREYAKNKEHRERIRYTYGYSFSSGVGVGDNLTLWRLYGNDGEGCSLVMPSPQGMYRIRYRRRGQDGEKRKQDREEDVRVAEQMEALVKAGQCTIKHVSDKYREDIGQAVAEAVEQVFEGYSHLVKDIAYSEEREWRGLKVRPQRTEIRYDVRASRIRRYVEGPAIRDLLLSFSEVRIGPKVLSSGVARDYIEYILRKKNLVLPDVQLSEQPYR